MENTPINRPAQKLLAQEDHNFEYIYFFIAANWLLQVCYTSNYRERYADEINRRFGAPDGPVLKDGQHKFTYAVRQAVITPETLFWLSSISIRAFVL